MTTTITTFGPFRAVEDAVVEVGSAVRGTGPYVAVDSHTAAPLGARQDAVPLCTPAVRGVERGPARRQAAGERTIVMD